MSKIRIDMDSLTMREMIDAAKLLPPGVKYEDGGPAVMPAMVAIIMRRTDPSFTYDQALDMRMSDLDMKGDDDTGEASAATNGTAPLSSLAAGS